jgi:hypothetical protein
VETKPDTTPQFYVNFRPTVTARDTVVSSGVPVRIPFVGEDTDGDPDSLRYSWQFEWEPFRSDFVRFDPDSLFIDAFFQPGEIGDVSLTIWAQDAGGTASESEPETIRIQVTASPLVPKSPVTRSRLPRGDGR